MKSFVVLYHSVYTEDGDEVSPSGKQRVISDTLEGAIATFRLNNMQEIWRVDVENTVLMGCNVGKELMK